MAACLRNTNATSSKELWRSPAPIELLEEWLYVLAHDNRNHMARAVGKQGIFKSDSAVQFIFLVCEQLNQSREVKYQAVELFDRFMVKHVEDLYDQALASSSGDRHQPRVIWNAILERVENQLSLRAVSCVQIASKLHSHYKVVTLLRARSMLKDAGHTYGIDGILKSELRVLKTLDYRVNVLSPVMCMDVLLEILSHDDDMMNVDLLKRVATKVLDMVYTRHQYVYDALFSKATGLSKMGPADKLQFSAVENDFLFLTSSVIACAAMLISQPDSKMMVAQLHHILAIPQADIWEFTHVLYDFINNGK